MERDEFLPSGVQKQLRPSRLPRRGQSKVMISSGSAGMGEDGDYSPKNSPPSLSSSRARTGEERSEGIRTPFTISSLTESFQQLRCPQNPEIGKRFGPVAKAVLAIFVLLAIILGIAALTKHDNFRDHYDAFVAEMRDEKTKNEAKWSEYESLRAAEAVKWETKFTELKRLLIKVSTAPDSQKKRAYVPRRKVYTVLDQSEILSCETNGQPIDFCLWARTLNGQRQIIMIDNQTAQDGGRTSAPGILYVGDGLKDGKCSIMIESVTEQEVGDWSCTLVFEGGAIFNGDVSITTMKPEYSIYFATDGGLQVYSLESKSVRTIGSSSDTTYGVAYDSVHDKIYWCSTSKIYRSNRDGTELETVSSEYSLMQGLSMDWVTGNLYVVTEGGEIMACDTNLERSFTCATVLGGQGDLEGLAVDPIEGTMYYTRHEPSPGIMKAWMNGSDPVAVVDSGLVNNAYGIVIDYKSSRLYWADFGGRKINSSNLQGGDMRVELSDGGPYGITLFNDTIIWGNYGEGNAMQQRPTEPGAAVQPFYNGGQGIRHITVAPPWNLPTNRINHCAGHSCSKVCVLTTSSFSCVS